MSFRILLENTCVQSGRRGGFTPRRDGFLVGRGWNPVEAFGTGEGAALSPFQWVVEVWK